MCSGGQLELMCTTGGRVLDWRFRLFLESETTVTDITRAFFSSDSASAALPRLKVNSTLDIYQRQFTSGVFISDWSC